MNETDIPVVIVSLCATLFL